MEIFKLKCIKTIYVFILSLSYFERSSEGAVGYGDPRDIKDFLEANGVKCWIDVERVGIVSMTPLFSFFTVIKNLPLTVLI